MVFSKYFKKILLITGVLVMINSNGYSQAIKYENYSCKAKELNFTVDQVSGWLSSEQEGSKGSFNQVIFYQPKGKNDAVKAAIVMTVKESTKTGYSSPTLDVIADDILRKRLKMEDAVLLERKKIKLFDTDAWDIQLTYKTLDKPYNINAKLITSKERIVIFAKNNKFYILRYENSQSEFSKFSKTFDYILGTLKFKNSK